MALKEGPAMLRQPVHGFAKRVEDTVARGMTALWARDERDAKGSRLLLAPRPGEQTRAAGGEGVLR